MNRCIQNTSTMKERDLDNVVLSLRVRGAEAVRFWKIMDLAKSRNPYVDRTVVLRELLGLSKPNILTIDDINFFRTGNKQTTLAPQLVTPKSGELNKSNENKKIKNQAS